MAPTLCVCTSSLIMFFILFCSFLIRVSQSHDLSEDSCPKENSYLWKVDTQPPIYLFGTMHVPYSKLWEHIPANVKTAFGSCSDVCLELRLSDPDTVSELVNCQQLPGDSTVETVLSKSMVDRIDNYFQLLKTLLPGWLKVGSPLLGGRGADFSNYLFNAMTYNWKRKRPIWILLMISSFTKEQIQSRNIPLLDRFLDNAAEGMGKGVQAIETPREQCRPLNKLSHEQVELALRVQLDHLEPLATKDEGVSGEDDSSIHTYRCGDFAGLISTTPLLPLPPLDNITLTSPLLTTNEITVLRETEEFLWKQMVVRRNRRMANRIDKLLAKPRNSTTFIALGAGHYLSDNSVVDRLIRKGHSVLHIPATTTIEGPGLPSNILQLGDPNVRLMPVSTSPPELVHNLPTLSPDTLESIWQKHLQTPNIVSHWSTVTLATPTPLTTTPQGNSVKDPHSPTSQNGSHLTVRSSPLSTEATDDLQDTIGTPNEEFPTAGEIPIVNGEVPNVSGVDSDTPVISHNPPINTWSSEVMELFLYPDHEQPNSGNSLMYNHIHTLTAVLLIALITLCLLLCEDIF